MYQTFAFLMVESRGIDSIVVALRQAVAHVAHPRRIEFVRFPSDEYHTNKKTARRRSFLLCVNTYFDTICVHPTKSAYTLSKMRTVQLTDKLEFESYCFNLPSQF